MVYLYQDTHDSRIDNWVAQHEHGLVLNNTSHHINYADAELHLWLRMQAWISSLKSRQHFLDVGCGLGRIIDKFGWLFEQTTCLDADAKRVTQAAEGKSLRSHLWELSRSTGHLAQMSALAADQRFVHAQFLERHKWSSNQRSHTLISDANFSLFQEFDVISMIHVIQHIPTHKVPLWLEQAHHMLGRKGLFILATTLRNTSSLNLEGHARQITPSLFNAIAAGSSASPAIPVRYYTANELRGLVRAAGLRVLEQSPFVYRICTRLPESQFVIATPDTSNREYDTPNSPPVDAVYVSQPMRPSIRRQRALRAKFRRRCGP